MNKIIIILIIFLLHIVLSFGRPIAGIGGIRPSHVIQNVKNKQPVNNNNYNKTIKKTNNTTDNAIDNANIFFLVFYCTFIIGVFSYCLYDGYNNIRFYKTVKELKYQHESDK